MLRRLSASLSIGLRVLLGHPVLVLAHLVVASASLSVVSRVSQVNQVVPVRPRLRPYVVPLIAQVLLVYLLHAVGESVVCDLAHPGAVV